MSRTRKTAAAGPGVRRNPLAALKMTDVDIASKPFLPAEIMSSIVDYLAVSDLMRTARVSHRMKEMVYEDARWVQRLKRMNVWNETEARQRTDSQSKPFLVASGRRRSTLDRNTVNGKGRPLQEATTLPNGTSDDVISSDKASLHGISHKATTSLVDGFDAVTVTGPSNVPKSNQSTEEDALAVIRRVKSIRGQARQEYVKVYTALGPFYLNALESVHPMECLIFKRYKLPEQQAQLLSQVIIFSQSDFSPGSGARERQLSEIASIFDTAALLEFRKGYEYKDIKGQMRQYAHVMHTLNGGQISIDLYLAENRILNQKSTLTTVADCLDYSMGHGQLSLQRIQIVFDRIGGLYEQEMAIIKQVFPDVQKVSTVFLEMVGREIFAPFLSMLFNDAHSRGRASFLRIVSGTFAQTRRFLQDHNIGSEPSDEMQAHIGAVLTNIYEPHMDLYLAEEFAAFKQKADAEIDQWDKALSDQAASTETFLMSNVNRQADKKDFMTSFKKVVMMPVNILPSFSGPSEKKSAVRPSLNGELEVVSNVPSRSSTPGLGGSPYAGTRTSTRGVPEEAPTTELAAKAAVMASKLEGIRSLFSIEVALNLVHSAKSSLERAAQFIVLEGSIGDAAKTQSIAIFILLLTTVGSRHVKAGFDKAIDHLGTYNPREATKSETSSIQVAPLATFLELVNVGDLIQQMLDVFYESELVHLRISNRDDFLDPSVKAKKNFEAMLDERVAAGLGKGIDVLMDEVEYICATTQSPTDFNPTTPSFDIGPTHTAKRVIDVVGSHIAMLTGSTDKTLLDVFSGEVGLRLFAALCKHLKRQRVSTQGAMPLLSDLGAYAAYVAGLKNHDLNSYFVALREVGQIYLIEGDEAKEMAAMIADGDRYRGIFTVEEVLEFAERRSDWLLVRSGVERAMYGQGCALM